jgi:hypothetical protein
MTNVRREVYLRGAGDIILDGSTLHALVSCLTAWTGVRSRLTAVVAQVKQMSLMQVPSGVGQEAPL